MKKSSLIISVSLFVVAFSLADSSFAQQGQTPGGTTGGATGATGGTTGGAAGGFGTGGGAGGTTQGFGGATTQGVGQGAGAGQGLAGDNAAAGFVGAANTDAFVGGARTSTVNTNTNRQFRAIDTTSVPSGGTQQQSANPRRVPVKFRVGFARPAPQQAVALAADGDISLTRYAAFRPELSSVNVSFSTDGVAQLSGTTQDASARRLAANLLRLQPGVRRVDNRILVPAE